MLFACESCLIFITNLPNQNTTDPHHRDKKLRMRPLTEEETRTMFDKLSKYIGADNIKLLVDRSDGTYCFRLQKERVYYVSEQIMKQVRIVVFTLSICSLL